MTSLIQRIAWVTVTLATLATTASASLPNEYYFWVTPTSDSASKESFVLQVDQQQGLAITALLADNILVGFSAHIASGGVAYNKDYYSPERHVWNWHVVSVDSFFDLAKTYFPDSLIESLDSDPSDIAANPDAWIARNGDVYTPRYYHITHAIDPTQEGLVVNVSNRGLVGQGEETLITGFIVQGGEPRNVVVRGLGPSLQNSGVQRVISDPEIELFRGSDKIASNQNWRKDDRADVLIQTGLQPGSAKEAALYLTLLPGAYTIHLGNEDVAQGVGLIEVYDIDGAPLPYHGQ